MTDPDLVFHGAQRYGRLESYARMVVKYAL